MEEKTHSATLKFYTSNISVTTGLHLPISEGCRDGPQNSVTNHHLNMTNIKTCKKDIRKTATDLFIVQPDFLVNCIV